ncbi:MAG: hypothetical protein FWH21_08975 [Kiritimatiellaeota bacterium]|nr:hypothetical protein [Kiritimatiellota bacterium]
MTQYFFGISPLTAPINAVSSPRGVNNNIANTHGIAMGFPQPDPNVRSVINTATFATKHPTLAFPNFAFMGYSLFLPENNSISHTPQDATTFLRGGKNI